MARTRTVFPRDTGLQVRMLFTMLLLGLVYVAFVGVLLSAGAGVGVMVVVIAGLLAAQLFLSDKLALASMGAKVVSPQEAPGLHAMIERLCIQADLPKPKIAVVCATTGIMNLLEPHELEGVMAHELSHVKNRDVLIMTMAGFFASLASMIAQFAFFFGGSDDDTPAGLIVFLVSMLVYVVS